MPWLLLLAFLIILAAAVAQAVTGFGFALVAVPLLTLAADPRTAVVAAALAGLALTVTVAVRERGFVKWRTAGALLAAAALGLPAGLLVLRVAPERLLTVLIGLAVLGCAALVWRGWRLARTRTTLLGVGVLAGVLSTSTGTNGPPLVAAFQAMGFDPRTFRATLAAVFTGNGLFALAGFGLAGQLTATAAQLGLAGVPAVALGWWYGDALFRRVDAGRFRQMVLGGLVLAGAVIVARAVTT